MRSLLSILDQVQLIADQTPPVDNGKSRFGNPAFRDFYDKLSTVRRATLFLLTFAHNFSFRNRRSCTRVSLDCPRSGLRSSEHTLARRGGTGRELIMGAEWNSTSFAGCTYSLLFSRPSLTFRRLCLSKLGVINKQDSKAIVARVFWKYVPSLLLSVRTLIVRRRYMTITRHLQTTYWLEPAGSHGAQGLDDYHFAVFSLSPLLPSYTVLTRVVYSLWFSPARVAQVSPSEIDS